MRPITFPMLLLVFSLAPVPCRAAEPGGEQAKAIAAIEKLGGGVTIDDKTPDKPVIGVGLCGADTGGLAWPTSAGHVESVRGGDVTDAGLACLEGLPRLQSLVLWKTKVTDAGLVHLKGLTQLQWLTLFEAQVGDAGLKHLEGLTRLQGLTLRGTRVTDAGLVHLKGLAQLRDLDLEGTQVTDAGLAHLEGLTQLQTLRLSGTRVTDAGLLHLKGLKNLYILTLSDTQVTDAGLASPKALPQLASLDLTKTRVTNAGVDRLWRATHADIYAPEPAAVQRNSDSPAGWPAEPNDEKGNAIYEIERLGGAVWDNANLPGKPVIGVCLEGQSMTEAAIQRLRVFPSLGSLSLVAQPGATAPGLKRLADLKSLRSLTLGGTAFTDATLADLQGLTDLEELELWQTGVTDAGLAHLAGLTKLKTLRIVTNSWAERTKVGDAGLAHSRRADQPRGSGLVPHRGDRRRAGASQTPDRPQTTALGLYRGGRCRVGTPQRTVKPRIAGTRGNQGH